MMVGLFLSGCGDTTTNNPKRSSETAQKSKELYEAMKRDAQKNLDEMDRKLKDWKERVDKASGETKTTLEKRYNELKKQRDEFADKVNDFGKASGDAWERLREGLEKAGKNVSDAFEKAGNEFK
jgi:ElaB/YqjD/DUF883 family membrane-anchored ribosome-binding protein